MNSSEKRVIFLADCQSFYASVEKAAAPWYRDQPLVVAGDPERRSGIVLAACPLAKKFGIVTGEALGQALAKCPDLVVRRPRMETYIRASMQITNILESYSDLVEPFSIDEQFIDVSASLAHFQCTPIELARHIQIRVRNETGIYTRIGIGENKILAKMACDNFAKKNETGVFQLTRDNMEELWARPTDCLFGVGTRTMNHLRQIGIDTIGKLARTPLPELKRKMKTYMKKQCDIWSEVMWRTANGYDDSPVTPDAFDRQKGIGRQTTLPYDYQNPDDINVVLLELSSLICQRARSKGYMGDIVHAGAQGADFERPSGFARQMKIGDPTQITREVFAAAKQLFQKHWDRQPVRKIWVSLGGLRSDDVRQLTLFDGRERRLRLERTMDEIREQFGPAAIFFGSSLKRTSQMKVLATKIGGHYK